MWILLERVGLNIIVAFFLALLIILSVGFLNATITLKAGIPSFITTLGTSMFFVGLVLSVSRGFPMSFKGNADFAMALNTFFMGEFRTSVIWFALTTLIFTIVLNQTWYGNWVVATGGNKDIARSMGVSVNLVKTVNFMLSALLAGLSGCLTVARFQVLHPTMGQTLPLTTIAAAVIGGNILMGGYGSIIGAALGAIVLGMTRSGLIQAGAPTFWYNSFVGIIIIVAVIINTFIVKVFVKGRTK